MTTYNDHTEKMLLLEVAKGDQTAYVEIYNRYKERFFAISFKLTQSAEISEDIVQEVFLALWHKRNLVGDSVNPVGYLMKMFHHAIYYHFRRLAWEKRMKAEVIVDSLQEDNSVEELLLQKENRAILDSIIAQLTPQQQLVYRLKKLEGMSREEIARKLNISVNTVRLHINAANKFMRNHFKKGSAIIWLFIWQHL